MLGKLFSKVGQRWRRKKNEPANPADDNLLLMNHNQPSVVSLRGQNPDSSVVIKKKDTAEIVGEAVNKLADRLEEINANISLQIQQNQLLVEKINQLPEILSDLPQQTQQQAQILAELSAIIKSKSNNDEKLMGVVGELNVQAGQQTQKLCEIDIHLQSAAEVDQRLCVNLDRFGYSLEKLDADTVTQTEWLGHVNRSFTATDQYIRETLAKQHKQFLWVLIISLGVCLLAAAGSIAGIVVLSR